MSEMEAPDRKKLKSTYQPPVALPPLPPGWTEHSAPTGHKYYYNAATKQSTYTRPAPVAAPPPPLSFAPPAAHSPSPAPYGAAPSQDYAALANSYSAFAPTQSSYTVPPFQQNGQDYNRRPHQQHQQYQRRPPPEDRPKRKVVIPECAPWILVYTKLGRRFVHNTETQESFWKFPVDVMKAVVEFDRLELENKLAAKDEGTGANNVPVGNNSRRRRSLSLQKEDEAALAAMLDDNGAETVPAPIARAETKTPGPEGEDKDDADDSSEYEEIEVTDDEDEEIEAGQARENGASDQPPEDGPVEFGEDDIAYQLAQMNADYGLDPGEYDDGLEDTYEEGAEGLLLTPEDQYALFSDLLSDHAINPFSPWDHLLENEALISDERWTILPTTKSRREAWDTWTRQRIQDLQAERAKRETLDPRIPYLRFLAEKATSPKLYWAEFKRKFKKEPEMKDQKIPASSSSSSSSATRVFGEKEREKLYRDHVARLKLAPATQKSDLAALLRSLPPRALHRASTLASLPAALLSDLRYVSLPAGTRDALIEAHISTLPPAPVDDDGEDEDGGSVEERAEREKRARERERREKALRERERRVEEDKRRRERDLRAGMGRLRDGERELDDAMRVGRGGLRAQLADDGKDSVPAAVAAAQVEDA